MSDRKHARTNDRKHALMKLQAGDYALPSNDGQTIWRIRRAEEQEQERFVTVWELWRWRGRVDAPEELAASVIEDDWEAWQLVESWLPTRRDAIKAAMRDG